MRSRVTAGHAVGVSRSHALPDLPRMGGAGGSDGRGLAQSPSGHGNSVKRPAFGRLSGFGRVPSAPVRCRTPRARGSRNCAVLASLATFTRAPRVRTRLGGVVFARARDAGPVRNNQSAIRCTSGRPFDTASSLGWADTERSEQREGRERAGLEGCVCCCFLKC